MSSRSPLLPPTPPLQNSYQQYKRVLFSPYPLSVQFSSVQSLSLVWLFATPWTAARQASLSITNSQSSLKLMSIESVMPSNHLILCRPLLLLPSIFLSIRVFSNESVLASGGQSTGVSASASVLPMNIQEWFPLGLIGLISLHHNYLKKVTLEVSANAIRYGWVIIKAMYVGKKE